MHCGIEGATKINVSLGDVFIEEVTLGLACVFEEEFPRKFRERTLMCGK